MALTQRLAFMILMMLLPMAGQAQDTAVWDQAKAQQHFINQHDTATWNQEMLARDLRSNQAGRAEPMAFGAFPVPEYALLGEGMFKGVGVGGNSVEFKDKTILYAHFFANQNAINEEYIPDKESEVFFTIMVLTDTVDTLHHNLSQLQISSRNNPDYLGQGYFKTKKHSIEFMAFQTATRDAYAIVNMRLFHLDQGRTILIAPQQDGSLRSLQLDSPILSHQEVSDYVKQILQQPKVDTFFMQKGAI